MENKNLKKEVNNFESNVQDLLLEHIDSFSQDEQNNSSNHTRFEKYSKKYPNYFDNHELHFDGSTFDEFEDESKKNQVDFDKSKILEEDCTSPIKEPISSKLSDTENIPVEKNSREKDLASKKHPTHKKFQLFFLITLFCIFLVVIIFSIYTIVNWLHDNHNTKQTLQQIEEITQVSEIEDNSNTELINQPEQPESDYWYYVKFPLIQVDFQDLLKKNKDTVAWIQVNNTNINYPVVQTTNNDYYLTHSYDNSVNEAGWVFMDYRNSPDFSGNNTILYAHSRLDKSMFGSLSRVLKSSWYENKDNHIIKLSTPTENTLWQIFSVYKIKEESYYITTNFSNEDSYQSFLDTIKNRSKYDFNTELNISDHILTLSTCYSDTERTVVHAKLIKQSKR